MVGIHTTHAAASGAGDALTFRAISISAYGIGAFWGPNYLLYLITYAVVLWGFECLAQLCSVASANPLMGMLN